MKIIILTPLNTEQLENGKLYKNFEKNLLKQWKIFKEKNNINFDLEIEFLNGTNSYPIGIRQINHLYFDDTIIEELYNKINNNDILGIIIDPILTIQEEICQLSLGIMDPSLANEIYDRFNKTIPNYILLLNENLENSFKQTNLSKEIYSEDKNTPILHGLSSIYQNDILNMYSYFINYNKNSSKLTLKK